LIKKLYTLKEVKKLLGVTTRTIQLWDKDGKVRVVRTIGGRRRIPERDKACSGVEGREGCLGICEGFLLNAEG